MANPPSPQRWNSDQARAALLDAEGLVSSKVKSLWSGFAQFAFRDNVLGVAVGLVVATAFTKLVSSLVSDVILPPISLLPFMCRNLGEQFLVLRGGQEYNSFIGYNTRAQALADGALIWTYGNFLDELMGFIGVGAALYTVAIVYGMCTRDSIIKKAAVKCRYCSGSIRPETQRCPACTSWLDGREDNKATQLVALDDSFQA